MLKCAAALTTKMNLDKNNNSLDSFNIIIVTEQKNSLQNFHFNDFIFFCVFFLQFVNLHMKTIFFHSFLTSPTGAPLLPLHSKGKPPPYTHTVNLRVYLTAYLS